MKKPEVWGPCRNCAELTSNVVSSERDSVDFLCVKCAKKVRTTDERLARKTRQSRKTDAKKERT